MPQETIVTTLSGQTEEDRLVVVLCQYAAGANALELRQQSWGDGVGWFTQSTVEMSPRQVANLRNALGGSPGQPPLPAQFRRVSEGHWQPRVSHADSA
ncbi:MAG: hypothetical protein CMJ59_12845 [Planctomycetaceae bacterium]|nr:hypothetical protein [Planctomycetaceae bacterium]